MKQGWEIKKLGEVYDVRDGTHDSPKYIKEGLALITSKNLKNDILNYDNVCYISEQDYININKRSKVDVGDILFAMIGTIGNPIVIKYEPDFAIKNVALFKVPKDQDSYFLKYFLDSSIVINKMLKDAKGTTQKFVGLGYLRNFEIPLPSLSEQKRIVAILDEAFADVSKAKANAEQNLKNAKELFNNYLHSIFTNKSNGWEIKKLGEVAEYFNGLTYSPKNVSDEGIIVLRSSNVQNDELDFSDIIRVNLPVKDKIIVKDGDILMCSRNGSKRLIGKTAKIKNLSEVMTFGTFMMIIRSQYNSYLSWFFKSNEFRRQISGGENTMINQITRYLLDDVVVPFPPDQQQEGIVLKLDSLSTEIKKLESIYQQKLNDLEELKKSILQKAFAGELVN